MISDMTRPVRRLDGPSGSRLPATAESRQANRMRGITRNEVIDGDIIGYGKCRRAGRFVQVKTGTTCPPACEWKHPGNKWFPEDPLIRLRFAEPVPKW